MYDSETIKQLTKDIEKQLGSIRGIINPLGAANEAVIKNFTPISSTTININSEQVAVSKLNGNRVLFTFKDAAGENQFMDSLNQKKGKFANLLFAIKCLFT
jgi:hypothetical protein